MENMCAQEKISSLEKILYIYKHLKMSLYLLTTRAWPIYRWADIRHFTSVSAFMMADKLIFKKNKKTKKQKNKQKKKTDQAPYKHVMSVVVHQRALYNRSSLSHLLDVQDGYAEISTCRVTCHVSQVTMHAQTC